jgi:hypothetical protein
VPVIRIETEPSPRPDALVHAPLRTIDSDVLVSWGFDPSLFSEPGRLTLLVLCSRLFSDQQERIDLFRRAVAEGSAEADVLLRRPHADDIRVPARADLVRGSAGVVLRVVFTVPGAESPVVEADATRTEPLSREDIRERLLDELALPDVGRSLERVQRFLQWVTHRQAPLLIVGAEGLGAVSLVEVVHATRGGGELLRRDAELDRSDDVLDVLDRTPDVAGVLVRRGDAGNKTVHRRLAAMVQAASRERGTGPRLYVTARPNSELETGFRKEGGDLFELAELRERPHDVLPALSRMLRRARPGARIFNTIQPEAARVLQAYDWPGNVSEMRELAEAVRLISGGAELRMEDLPVSFMSRAESSGAGVARWSRTRLPARSHGKRGRPAKHLSMDEVRQALDEAGGSRTRAAKMLGVSRTTLWRKIAEMGDALFDDATSSNDER